MHHPHTALALSALVACTLSLPPSAPIAASTNRPLSLPDTLVRRETTPRRPGDALQICTWPDLACPGMPTSNQTLDSVRGFVEFPDKMRSYSLSQDLSFDHEVLEMMETGRNGRAVETKCGKVVEETNPMESEIGGVRFLREGFCYQLTDGGVAECARLYVK